MNSSDQDGRVGVVVLAAGDGQRLGHGPKALVSVADRPLLAWTLDSILANDEVGDVVVVAHRQTVAATRDVVDSFPDGGRVQVVEGGSTRQRSAARGVDALDPDLRYVAVAEAARPFVPRGVIDRMFRCLLDGPSPGPAGVVPGIRLFDTIRGVEPDGSSTGTLDRDSLRAAQTPQLFCRACLMRAYRLADESGETHTDDAAAVENSGGHVLVVPGDPDNFKITIERDLRLAELIMATTPKAGA
ncbi:2-C-methyl-D-erythritol 4-phosphate cytidylyltransferase [Actinokineospora sp.]|uniref:2-C-methyl-D-erythritol 4-phosphate cytidylyltransferase n=1 Tax=Actinokineospora sp. TaxID=1872133 RepID=UPI0040382228